MMTQKSNEEIYKSLSEEERNVTVTSVELTDKAFKMLREAPFFV